MIWLIGIGFLFLACIIVVIILKVSSQVNERLGQTTALFGDVKAQLGKLEATNAQILEVSKNVSSLQDLLRAPKFRGEMAETLLENLLSQVLPKDYYAVQYRFRTADIVDAVIKLGERIVPVDAKFSLENFQKMLSAASDQEKNNYRRKFIQDAKNRIDEVAAKYILPAENTYDFAFMYIPAENIYYEIIIKEDLLSYGLAKKVIPVSPNTFYAYLQVICLGLKGLKVEENAKQILKNLSALSGDIIKFKDDFDLLGRHLSNSLHTYEDGQKKLDRFSDKLHNIQEK